MTFDDVGAPNKKLFWLNFFGSWQLIWAPLLRKNAGQNCCHVGSGVLTSKIGCKVCLTESSGKTIVTSDFMHFMLVIGARVKDDNGGSHVEKDLITLFDTRI